MNNKCAGIIERLIEKVDKDILLNEYYKNSPRFREGAATVKIMAKKILNESIKEDKPVERITDEEIEASIVKLFNKFYEYVYTTDDAEQRGEWKRQFAGETLKAIRDKLSV